MSARPATLTIPPPIPHDQAPASAGQQSAQDDFDTRALPSPTPSEAEALDTKGFFARPKLSEWRMWFQRKYWSYWIIGIIALGVTIAFIVLHRRISNALEPFAQKLKDLPAGWLIPVGLLIILSFPPLFGHEIVAVLCGVVWGLGIGFGIVALGTLLGELASFFAFRTVLRRRAERLEHDSLKYGLLSHVIREGGFKIALMARLSAIPPHFLTVIFSTSGMKVWVFTLAAILSLPRQFATVYLGLLFDSNGKGCDCRNYHCDGDHYLGSWLVYQQEV
ncbi:hypothetical protein PENSPDRAFT_412610 [Peniophora sp. CONT]|nr:hypothetical protein PENSPDRAFT_412610 [Peniophora sp. CONT]